MHRVKIWVAIVGAIAAVAVALLSNMDKLQWRAESTPDESERYVPTDDINIEIRHQVELSGLRDGLQAMKARLESQYKDRYKLSDDEVACMIDTSFFGNDFIEIVVEAHKKYLTLREVQELNRIYLTKSMIEYRKKESAILQEVLAQMDRLTERKYKTFAQLTRTRERRSTQSCPQK